MPGLLAGAILGDALRNRPGITSRNSRDRPCCGKVSRPCHGADRRSPAPRGDLRSRGRRRRVPGDPRRTSRTTGWKSGSYSRPVPKPRPLKKMPTATELLVEYNKSEIEEQDMGKRNTKGPIRRGKPGRSRPTASSGLALLEGRPMSSISISPALAEPEPISVKYGFVRSRQLEGTFPGVPETGVWTITSQRIAYGWGLVNFKDWPDSPNDGEWPPIEPDGLDRLAKGMRLGPYHRTRSLKDCKYVACRRPATPHNDSNLERLVSLREGCDPRSSP